MGRGNGPRPLDRQSSEPLWAQLLADLRRRLASGELGDRFPTDRELTADYGVSRQTARDAVRRLRDEGLVRRERGRGSFVEPERVEVGAPWGRASSGPVASVHRSVTAAGHRPHNRVLCLEERRDADAATQLGLPDAEPLVYVERLRLADDEPVAHCRAWLPGRIAAPLLAADLRRTTLYDALVEHCGVAPTGGWERFEPRLSDDHEGRLLGIGARRPVLGVERLARAGALPVEWRQAVLRADRWPVTAPWGLDGAHPT